MGVLIALVMLCEYYMHCH